MGCVKDQHWVEILREFIARKCQHLKRETWVLISKGNHHPLKNKPTGKEVLERHSPGKGHFPHTSFRCGKKVLRTRRTLINPIIPGGRRSTTEQWITSLLPTGMYVMDHLPLCGPTLFYFPNGSSYGENDIVYPLLWNCEHIVMFRFIIYLKCFPFVGPWRPTFGTFQEEFTAHRDLKVRAEFRN